VKLCVAAGIVAAPRVIWALDANAPASKIAAVAETVTTSLRIAFLLNANVAHHILRGVAEKRPMNFSNRCVRRRSEKNRCGTAGFGVISFFGFVAIYV
jgi:hypothetical protein